MLWFRNLFFGLLLLPTVSFADISLNGVCGKVNNITSSTWNGQSVECAASCNTEEINAYMGGDGSSQWMGENGPNIWAAHPFRNTNNATICAITFVARYGQDDGGTFKIGIYSDNAGQPGTQIGGWSTNIDLTIWTSSLTTNKIPLTSSATLTANTTNWIVIQTSMTTDFMYQGLADVSGLIYTDAKNSTDGTTWVSRGAGRAPRFILWK